jgi:hypothetical protein
MRRKPMQSNTVSVHYNGVEITYRERGNKWVFDVRGREREADSLEAAKLIIDRPEPKEKPPFDRFKAWWVSYGDEPVLVEVTSVALVTASWRNNKEVWITEYSKERRKVNAADIYPCNAHNDALIAEMKTLSARQHELAEAEDAAKKKLKAFKVPA